MPLLRALSVKMKSRIPTVMALFKMNLMSEAEVVTWADQALLNDTEDFEYISELSLKGPKYCANMPEVEFPRSREFSFVEEFALRTYKINISDPIEKNDFVRWVSSACMGEDLEVPEINFGYLIDHYFFECEDLAFANKYLKAELKEFKKSHLAIAQGIWDEIT